MLRLTERLPDQGTAPFTHALSTFGDKTALITPDGEISYRKLATEVAATARQLGERRRLVLLAGANRVEAVVAYLAALTAGHPILLVPGGNLSAIQSLITAYDPDVVIGSVNDEWVIDERRQTSTHTLHPDLALLLSTSGSTGSPKLVRLSSANIQANAEAIADYLDIRDSDRAATTLPMHYSYGLSVINSHLLRGAGLILTDLSVADTCFWDLFRGAGGTSFAGVPYTFELLDRIAFDTMRLPRLRYITQAGGRLTPDRVTRYAALGRRDGWRLFVMYGQTEATARMAYLPPELAESQPHAIGVPIPGGAFQLQPLPDRPEPDTGELVYTGPNVMLGYAESPADLRLGRTVEELHTGDIARRTPEGLYELIGRRSRFAKILGLRVDPQRVETMFGAQGIDSCCLGGDDELVVAVTSQAEPRMVQRMVAQECGLPPRAVRVHALRELPRLATGKPDYSAIRELASPDPATERSESSTPVSGPVDLCHLYAEILDRSDVTPDSSFVSLGGDSLSYVEMSIRLEQALGHLPDSWHTRPLRELRPSTTVGSPRRRALETSVALRAVAILLIVGSHISLFTLTGGAHLLLGVAGFNFARFQLTGAAAHQRRRHFWGSIGRVALPSMAWIGLALLVTTDYSIANIFLLNAVLGPHNGRTEWHFWFIEALIYILVALAALLAVPGVDRLERRYPFGLPMALMALGLVARYDLLGLDVRERLPSAVTVFWLFALGWAAAKTSSPRQRFWVSASAVVTVPGFFGEPRREAIIIAGLLALVWLRSVPSLGSLNRVAGLLASSSLYIYLTHWQVYPRVDDYSKTLALVAALAVGIGYATLVTYLTSRLRNLRGARNHRPKSPAWPGAPSPERGSRLVRTGAGAHAGGTR